MAFEGTQQLNILVESFDYQTDIEPIVITVTIEVDSCEVTGLIEPEDSRFSSLYLAFSLPLNLKISLPLYEPEPACNLSNADVDYSIVENGNPLPDWVTFDVESRTLTAQSADPLLLGQTFKLELKASYLDKASASMKFAIVIIDRDGDSNLLEQVIDIGEEEVDEEKEEETDDSDDGSTSEPVSSWDGWKKLLLIDLDLGDDFKLPEPITTPGYVPTPPRAKMGKFSVKGETTIKFSEPVFQLKDIDTKMTKVPRLPSTEETRKLSMIESSDE